MFPGRPWRLVKDSMEQTGLLWLSGSAVPASSRSPECGRLCWTSHPCCYKAGRITLLLLLLLMVVVVVVILCLNKALDTSYFI